MTSICFKFRAWSHKPARVCCWKSVKFMFKKPACVASISLEGRFSHDSKVLHPSHVVFSAQDLQGSRWIPSRRASSTLSGHTKWGGTARSSGYCQVSVWVIMGQAQLMDDCKNYHWIGFFRGNLQEAMGNYRTHQIWGFPVDVPWNQSIEMSELYKWYIMIVYKQVYQSMLPIILLVDSVIKTYTKDNNDIYIYNDNSDIWWWLWSW